MLCPEVWNFPPPKVKTFYKKNGDLETATKVVNLNNFYKSAIVVCPDEINTPQAIEDSLLEDSDYYKVFDCPLTQFIHPVFIQHFVKCGKLYCLSDASSCIVENCFAVTPDGTLTLHILKPLFQTLGLEGVQRPNNYFEITIDLVNLKNRDRVKRALSIMKSFNFFMSWVPDEENICPSSIAKYFCDQNIHVTCHSLEIQRLTPDVKQIPTLVDSEIEELVEWIGMISIGGDIDPTETYVSTYSEPECDKLLSSTRISVLIIKGFITSNIIINTCTVIKEYTNSRDFENYWTSMSVQSIEDSLWQWTLSSPRMFCSQNCSCNIFFCGETCSIYSAGQLKYS